MSDLQNRLQSAIGSIYTFERELGGGGMSRVFVANETKLHRQVVVKVLPPNLAAELSVERFEREIALAATLQHPHIVPLHSAGHAGGLPYFSMPFVEGETLRERIARPLPLSDAIRILREIASALGYAHDKGIIHRDLKPENVLLSRGSAMVTDFGVAKALTAASTRADNHTLTSAGIAIGTPAYMSPEQALASPDLDARSDIYAFGVIAYEMFAGRQPFRGSTAQAVIAAHIAETPEHISRVRPDLQQAMATLIMRCLAKDPAGRPAAAADLISVLDAITAPHAAGTSPTTRRRVAIIAAALLTIGASVGIWVRARSATGVSNRIDSIAVLPLETAVGDTATEWLSEGLTDGLSAEMVRLGLHVPSRSFITAVTPRTRDPRAIAKELGVSSVFVWRASRLGTRLRVRAELTDASGFSLLQKTVERDGRDLTGVQDEVLRELLAAMRERLGVATARNQNVRRHTPPPEAVELYVRALHTRSLGSRDALNRAIAMLKEATSRDPEYTDAFTALAYTYAILADGYEAPVKIIPAMTDAVRRAAAIDSSAEVMLILAALDHQYLWRYEEALRGYTRVMELSPNRGDVYLFRGMVKAAMGDTGALQDLRTGITLAPYDPLVLYISVFMLAQLGQPDEALKVDAQARGVDSGFFYIEAWSGYAYRAKKDFAAALRVDRAARALLGRPTAGLVMDFVAVGQRDSALRALASIDSVRKTGTYVAPEFVAAAWMAVGNREKAFDWLAYGAESASGFTGMVPLLPGLLEMRDDPRFAKYLERVHLKYLERTHLAP